MLAESERLFKEMYTELKRTVISFPRVLGWLSVCFLIVPILIVLPVSFTSKRYLSWPGSDWSLRHYSELVGEGGWLPSISDSLIVATSAALLALILGTLFAVGNWRLNKPLTRNLRLLILLPIIVPPIVHAVAFYRAWAVLDLLDTYLGLILFHTMKALPFVVLSVTASLINLDPSLEQASRSLGASAKQTLFFVLLPQVKPGMLAGVIFAFITSWDEIIVAIFITSREVYTLPKRIWDGIFDNVDPAIAALGAVMIVLTSLALVVGEWLDKRRKIKIGA
jgi:putative spermidine/putrescine transport system permease protein